MATLHILEQTSPSAPGSPKDVKVVIHVPVPIGNNDAGATWKSVFLSAGESGSTVMVEGTGPGQISPLEKVQIVAGDVIEFVTDMDFSSLPQIETDVQTIITQRVTVLKETYQQYGVSSTATVVVP